jgi:hypothetical protein
MLDNGFSDADLTDAEAGPFLGGSTPERLKLFGSHGQRPWFHEVMSAAGVAYLFPRECSNRVPKISGRTFDQPFLEAVLSKLSSSNRNLTRADSANNPPLK